MPPPMTDGSKKAHVKRVKFQKAAFYPSNFMRGQSFVLLILKETLKVRPTQVGHRWDRYLNAPFVISVDQAPFSNSSYSL